MSSILLNTSAITNPILPKCTTKTVIVTPPSIRATSSETEARRTETRKYPRAFCKKCNAIVSDTLHGYYVHIGKSH